MNSQDYVGDKIEFMDSYGTWHERVLRKNKTGLFVNHNGQKVYVKHHNQHVVGYRFRAIS